MLENDTFWGGTYLYGLYMGVPPPPPPRNLCAEILELAGNAATRSVFLFQSCRRGTKHVTNIWWVNKETSGSHPSIISESSSYKGKEELM